MPSRSEAEKLFLQHLAFVERVAAQASHRAGLSDIEAEEFSSQVLLKLMQDDYAAIRAFRGTSRISTYLTTIVTRQFIEHVRQRGGRWRASAAAMRHGPPAIELERLIYRHGYSLAEAAEKLRSTGATTSSNGDLAQLLARLPVRDPLRPVKVPSEHILDRIESGYDQEPELADSDSAARSMALDEALKTLEPEDRLIVQMRFGDGYSVADVARVLQVPPKTLYRRVEGLRLRLREYLENSGIQDFVHPGILGPDGLPIREEVLQESRIITDISSANSRIISLVERDPATMYDLSPRQFEELVAELLSKKGYTIELTPASKDGGFDMYAARKDGIGEFLYLVECKRYAQFRPVGVDVVRSLYGVVQKERATAGIIVTTSRFTRGAAEFQTTVPHQLSLRDYLHLQEWLAPTFF